MKIPRDIGFNFSNVARISIPGDIILAFRYFSGYGVAGLAFLSTLIYAAYAWGNFLGLLLGLIPAALLAALIGLVGYYLWFVAFPVFIVLYFGFLFQLLEFARTGHIG